MPRAWQFWRVGMVRQKGFTLGEVVVAVAILGMLAIIAVPSFSRALRRARVDVAVRHISKDLRQARSQAIKSGWEYRVVGFNAGTSDLHQNQYRLLARRSSAFAWPLDNAAPFVSDTLIAGAWTQVGLIYPGIAVSTSTPGAPSRFGVTFDSRGAASELNGSFSPFEIAGSHSASRALRVSPTGRISIQ